ncbi:MAG: hypothetical protein GX896_04185 [Clostridiales bacterium]|nr:hypothetical protein [Clostridiales bacterium]
MDIAQANSGAKFEKDDYLVYGTAGVCQLIDIEMRCFDGKNKNDYFKLIPMQSIKSTYYVPVNKSHGKLRKLLSKDEVYALIDALPMEEVVWSENARERKMMFDEILKGGDYEKILAMLRTLYNHQKKRIELGKKLMAYDETTMRTAELLIYQEFSFVLGIPEESVEAFITDRVNENAALES